MNVFGSQVSDKLMRSLILIYLSVLMVPMVFGQVLQHPKNLTGRDGLEIQIAEGGRTEKGFPSSKYVVDDDGMITMWKIGKVQTKGKTHDALAKEIAAAYEKTYLDKEPKVVVSRVSAASEGPWNLFAVSDSWLSDLYQAKTAQRSSWPRNVSLRNFVRGYGEISGYDDFRHVVLHRNGQAYRYDLEIGKHKGVKLYPRDVLQVVSKGGGEAEPKGVNSWAEVQLTVAGVHNAGQRRINGTYKVAEDGTITMWKIGKVDTKGKTADQLAVDLKDAYVKAGIYGNPVFVVPELSLEKWQVNGDFITFMTAKSGDRKMAWAEGTTINSAVQSNGWGTKSGYSKWVKLYRNEKVYIYNLLLERHQKVKVYLKDVIEVYVEGEGRVSFGKR